jgi:hypothetical protein
VKKEWQRVVFIVILKILSIEYLQEQSDTEQILSELRMLHLQATNLPACPEVNVNTTAHMYKSFLLSFDPTFANQLGRGTFIPMLMLKQSFSRLYMPPQPSTCILV